MNGEVNTETFFQTSPVQISATYTGKDLAKEVRECFIPYFSNRKDLDAFEKAFERLLLDLRAEEAIDS